MRATGPRVTTRRFIVTIKRTIIRKQMTTSKRSKKTVTESQERI